ncbi:hypothetical protein P4O66_021456, partial [Electrophorus voltai]
MAPPLNVSSCAHVIPGNGSKKRKRKKGGKRPHKLRIETLRHPGLTPHFHHGGGGHWTILGGPPSMVQGQTQSCRPQPDSEDWHVQVDFTGSYKPYIDFYEGYMDYGDNGECSNVSLRSDLGFDYGEDPSMEVEEVLSGHPPNISDVESADSKSDEPPALKIPPKAPPRRCRLGASKPSSAAQREATAFEEETPSTWAYSSGTRVPVPKPRRGNVSVPVSVVILIPVLPPAVLLALARVGSLGPWPRHLALALRPQPDKLERRESRCWGGALS